MTKSSDASEDLISGLRPDERLGAAVGEGDVGHNRSFQGARADMRTAFDLFLAQQSEPALDEIQPRRTGRREMQVEARMPYEPAVNRWRFVGAVIVENQVDGQIGRYRGVDRLEELAELDRPVVPVQLPDDLPGLRIQGGEQRRRAMAQVVMRASLRLTRAHGQQRLRAIQGLDLALLVDAQHQRPVRRIQVQPDNVPDLLNEQGVFRQLEGLGAMRLQ